MTELQKLIQRIKDNKWREEDYDHPLARRIVEEFINSKKFHGFFDEVRRLSDTIIQEYLSLDIDTKIGMVSNFISLRKYFNTDLNEFAYNKIMSEAIEHLESENSKNT